MVSPSFIDVFWGKTSCFQLRFSLGILGSPHGQILQLHGELHILRFSGLDLHLDPEMLGSFREKYGYGSIPINTIFSGMNIHKSQLF